uniref:Uncharacterized protein n=1 Tax=Arundo donax TaxID=35708 RepID=A0A0A9G5D3_ARUDO
MLKGTLESIQMLLMRFLDSGSLQSSRLSWTVKLLPMIVKSRKFYLSRYLAQGPARVLP